MLNTAPSNNVMKAALASGFGNPDDVLKVSPEVPKPTPTDKDLLIRVHAVSLSPGDYRTLLGDKTVVANPTMPYIPGGDVAGIVEHVPSKYREEFNIGDRVMATWDMYGQGGLAECALVHPDRTVKLPPAISFVDGAALANSAGHAVQVVKQANVQNGDRVLVLGASGGVGSVVVQLLKASSSSSCYVAATSTDTALLETLGVDRAINYKKEDWSIVPEFQENRFDIIIDCAEGRSAWKKCSQVVKGKKDGGRFIAVVAQDWHIDGRHWYQVFGFLLPPLGRVLWNPMRRNSPQYTMFLNSVNKEQMQEVLEKVAEGQFKVIVDSRGPFPLTTQGVCDAFNLHIARGGHGKIVIEVA